jgi:hypothetical protein
MTHASHLADLAFTEEGKEYPDEIIDLFPRLFKLTKMLAGNST